MTESGSFETQASYLEEGPSPKRARYDGQPEIVSVSDDGGAVTITVPQTQFEIEINSQQDEEEGGSPSDEISQIQAGDLAGPAFEVIHEAEGLLDDSHLQQNMEDDQSPGGGGEPANDTLNAIGALIQMQQSAASGSPSQSQLILTRSSSEAESGQHSSTPLYVMIPPSSSAEILQAMGQSRPIAPKVASELSSGDRVIATREAQRKATHNEVERRRRDRINELIKMLAQIVPGCQKKDATTGNIVGYVYSKGTVLDKTVEYLRELIAQNEQLASTAKLAEKSANALSVLQNQITVLEKENAFLRAQIIQFGIDAAAATGAQPSSTARPAPPPPFNTSLPQSLLNSVSTQSSQSNPTPAQAVAQQLLLSLAQTLTNNPLLTQSPPSSTLPPQLTTPSLSSSPSPSRLAQQLPSPLVYSTPSHLGGSPANLTTPLLSSLVQTLSSIANTTTTTATPLPRVSLPPPSQSQTGLSATAAASLLNTLLLAQNMLTNAGSGSHESAAQLGSSVLNTMGLDGASNPQQ